MKSFLFFLLLTSLSSDYKSLYTVLDNSSIPHFIIDMENDKQTVRDKLKGRVKINEKKRNRRLAKLLTNLGFSFVSDNDSIILSIQYPEFGTLPLTLDASSSSCDLHFEREDFPYRDNSLPLAGAMFNNSLTDLNHLVDKTLIQLISRNDTSAFHKLYKMFAVKTFELPPRQMYQIIIHKGRVIKYTVWNYSVEPAITISSAIESGTSIERIKEIIEEVKRKILSSSFNT